VGLVRKENKMVTKNKKTEKTREASLRRQNRTWLISKVVSLEKTNVAQLKELQELRERDTAENGTLRITNKTLSAQVDADRGTLRESVRRIRELTDLASALLCTLRREQRISDILRYCVGESTEIMDSTGKIATTRDVTRSELDKRCREAHVEGHAEMAVPGGVITR
jgi:hypothetical protein